MRRRTCSTLGWARFLASMRSSSSLASIWFPKSSQLYAASKRVLLGGSSGFSTTATWVAVPVPWPPRTIDGMNHGRLRRTAKPISQGGPPSWRSGSALSGGEPGKARERVHAHTDSVENLGFLKVCGKLLRPQTKKALGDRQEGRGVENPTSVTYCHRAFDPSSRSQASAMGCLPHISGCQQL